ncbi:MAG TPA: hypothetical protein VJS68_02930 [Thermoplasmata archaeon]|nr:hypothetical protein [Thermoplasmata archaeon]
MRVRSWAAISVALAVVTSGLVVASLPFGGTFESRAPSSAAPAIPVLGVSAPAAYDAADGYDVWWLPDGSTWTYEHATWSNLTASAGTIPHMERNVDMTYDARDGYVLLFGGEVPGNPPQSLANTWVFRGGHWSNLTGSLPVSPPERRVGVMSYDSHDGEVILFGGSAPNLAATNDTWIFAGGGWSQATVSGPPPIGGGPGLSEFIGFVDDPSLGYAVYYDPLQSCVPSCASPALWTFRGGTWTNLSGAVSPSLRLNLFVAFTYDSSAGYLVALSACQNTPPFPCPREYGTFVFTGTGWKDVPAGSEPPGRNFASWVDDPSDSGVMVLGGCCWIDYAGISVGWQDVWLYTSGGWTEYEPWGGGAPSPQLSDGTWIGVGMVSMAAVVLLARGKRAPPATGGTNPVAEPLQPR